MNVGVLGGGQLGRMLALAGYPLGLRFTFLDPATTAAAGDVGELIVARYDDAAALERFARAVDVVTYEFESVPVAAVRLCEQFARVWPPVTSLHTAQDRLHEKECFARLGVATAPYAAVFSLSDLSAAVTRLGVPGILKSRTLGYDGKGQCGIARDEDAAAAWDELGGVPLIYERFVDFERELSVLAARGSNGETVLYPLVENHHRDGILRLSVAPAPHLTRALESEAEAIASRVMDALGHVGVLAIELFQRGGALIANEMAPRVHNSGHWTIEGAETSQFENHVRAVCGLPLGSSRTIGHSAMVNIIGTVPPLKRLLEVRDAHVHLYGKSAAPARKLGHVTVRAELAETVADRVTELRRLVEDC